MYVHYKLAGAFYYYAKSLMIQGGQEPDEEDEMDAA